MNNLEIRPYLLAQWEKTLIELNVTDHQSLAFEEILKAYDSPGRVYHTTEHLYHCFMVLEKLVAKLPGTANIKMALWYHDFVQGTLDNEERSACFALARLTFLPPGQASLIADLLRATKHLEPPRTREAQVLVDVDLSILGETSEVFDRYETQIREEYSWVEELTFRKARTDLLASFLSRPTIYSTHEFKSSQYETRARINLARSVSRLTRGMLREDLC